MGEKTIIAGRSVKKERCEKNPHLKICFHVSRHSMLRWICKVIHYSNFYSIIFTVQDNLLIPKNLQIWLSFILVAKDIRKKYVALLPKNPKYQKTRFVYLRPDQ